MRAICSQKMRRRISGPKARRARAAEVATSTKVHKGSAQAKMATAVGSRAASSGAAWVAVHHGGGVGMGKSIHAGAQVVADGTPDAAFRLERVLTNDPATGVLRHVDAGYQRAIEVADQRGVRIPMLGGSQH